MSRHLDSLIERAASTLRHALLVHCYRMLGGVEDAEDAVQEAHEAFLSFLDRTVLSSERGMTLRARAWRANGSPAVTLQVRDEARWAPLAVLVLAARGPLIGEITGFTAPGTLARFDWGAAQGAWPGGVGIR
jgi:hypothetical protein